MIEPGSRPRPTQLADLKPPRYLNYCRAAAPGTEPDRSELVPLLRAGQHPHALVASRLVVIGANLVAAALHELGLVAADAVCGTRRETAGVRS